MTEDEMVGWHHDLMDMSLSKLWELVMERQQCPEPRWWVRALERKGSKSCVLRTYGKEQLSVRWLHLIVGPCEMNILFHRHWSWPFP